MQVETAIVFANRKTTVRELNKHLQKRGFASGEIHGDIAQHSRLKELERFKSGDVNILVASDVAARGLDIKGVSHVFNYDTPWHPDDYVHRIGRTGRAGAKGRAFTFVAKEDAEAIANVEKLTGAKIKVFGKEDVRVELADPSAEPEREEGERNEEAREERLKKPRRDRKSKKAHDETGREERDEKPDKRSRSSSTRSKNYQYNEHVAALEWNGPKPGFLDVGFG